MIKSREKMDLIIKNGKIVDIFQNRIIEGNIAIKDERIVGVGDYDDAETIIDAHGLYISPNFTDGHVHIESSMVSPAEFLKCIVPRGVTTIIADPHEITNVCGLDGIKYMIDEIKMLPADVYMMLPSSVPSTPFETSGAVLAGDDYEKYLENENIFGLGEMMDFYGVINHSEDVHKKLKAARDKEMIIDGHAPMIAGRDLDEYVLSGVKTDHECSTVKELEDRIQRGMYVQIREGTAAKNLETLIKGVNKYNINRCFFCTDDRHPEDLIEEGSIDNNVRKAIELGLEPLDALKMATINPMECYGIKDNGAIAPGYFANFFTFEDLNDIRPVSVFYRGRKIAENGEVLVDFPKKLSDKVLSSVNIGKISLDDLKLPLKSGKVNVIQIQPHSLVTKKVIRDVEVEDGYFKYSENGIKKIVLIERHSGRSSISIGLIEGYPIVDGAAATTISHDSHNLVAIGDNDGDILEVIEKVKEMQGGLALSKGGKIIGSLVLDIAGIMSSKPIEEVREELDALLKIAKDMGLEAGLDPFMTMGFMALPVIPDIKITDRGLFDVVNNKFLSIEA